MGSAAVALSLERSGGLTMREPFVLHMKISLSQTLKKKAPAMRVARSAFFDLPGKEHDNFRDRVVIFRHFGNTLSKSDKK